MKTLYISLIIFSFALVSILSNVAFGSEPCPASGYIHYGPSRQSIPCYLVSPQYNSTLEEQSKIINTTNASNLFNNPVFCDQHFDQGPTLGETIGEQQCENAIYQINYNDSKLLVANIINKTTFKVRETITVIPELTNIGNHTVAISYCGPLFVTLIIDQHGKIVSPQYAWACPLIDHSMILAPNVSTPGDSYGQIITLDTPGNYTMTSIASFGGIPNTTVLWSKPLQITVLPEKYIENQTGIVRNEQSDCDKKISDERDSILNSIDKRKAVLLATNDTDFRGLVGDSTYTSSGISVGSNDIDYNNCKLINPNIQIQFNVLKSNTNLGNCPYVIVLEDPSASKVLAVDLGTCSSSMEPPANNPSSLPVVIVLGGIVGLAVVGISIYIIMKKK
jgi:hypothetical protein